MKIKLKSFLKGLLIMTISILIAIPLLAISIIFTPLFEIITFKWQRGLDNLGQYMTNISIIVSKFINVSCCSALNTILLNKGCYYFGDVDDTFIYVIAKNKQIGCLSLIGRIICFIIRLISYSSLDNALNDKLMHDQDSLMRLGEDKYSLN